MIWCVHPGSIIVCKVISGVLADEIQAADAAAFLPVYVRSEQGFKLWSLRRGAGAADRDGLENRCRACLTVGSNPTPSACFFPRFANGGSSIALPTVTYETDICVIGGGLAGLCAALAAARHGAEVILMHDRPVLGGNSSSEIRMHICGADRRNAIPNLRETGILEELRLENLYRNPQRSYSLWDTVLYAKAIAEPNLRLLLNCSCQQAEMNSNHIQSVKGWQLTSQTHHNRTCRYFH